MIPHGIEAQIFAPSFMCVNLHWSALNSNTAETIFKAIFRLKQAGWKWSGNRVLKEPLTSSPFTRYLSKLLLC